jgi:hypothetical protein
MKQDIYTTYAFICCDFSLSAIYLNFAFYVSFQMEDDVEVELELEKQLQLAHQLF